MRKALLILVAALPLLATARKDREDRAQAFTEQVRRDAQYGNEELRAAAQALLRANEEATRRESEFDAQRAVEEFYRENPNGRSGGLVVVPGPMKDVDKKQLRQAMRFAALSGQAMTVGGGSDKVSEEDVQAALGGTFWAEVRYQEARKNAGLPYNTDLEPHFHGSRLAAPRARAAEEPGPTVPATRESWLAEIMPPKKAKPGSAAITLSSRIMGRHNRRQCMGGMVKGTFGAVSIRLGDPGHRPLLMVCFVIDNSRSADPSIRFIHSGYELSCFLYDLRDGECVHWCGARTIASESGVVDSPFSERSSAERRSMQQVQTHETAFVGGIVTSRILDRFEIGDADSLLFPDEACYYRLEVWCGGVVAAVKEGSCNHARKPEGLPEDWFVPLHNRETPPFRKPFFSKVHLYPPRVTYFDGEWPLGFR